MIPVLFEDNHLLVVIKPAGMPVQGDATGDSDLLSVLKEDIKIRFNKPGNVFLGLVHRLDRPVGGVMVFARTSKAAARLSEEIRARRFYKHYLAVVQTSLSPSAASVTLRGYLIKDEQTNMVRAAASQEPGAMEAVLAYTVRDSRSKLSLLEINLETGRPHQIRVQLAQEGMPIAGDKRYGGKASNLCRDIALFSHTLSFAHPITKEMLYFEAPLPEAFPWSVFRD